MLDFGDTRNFSAPSVYPHHSVYRLFIANSATSLNVCVCVCVLLGLLILPNQAASSKHAPGSVQNSSKQHTNGSRSSSNSCIKDPSDQPTTLFWRTSFGV
jgi:hypothetical protein